jgi:thiol:disulfide interchange protein DsbC
MWQNSPITQSTNTMNFSRIAFLTAVLTCTQACAQSTTPAPPAKATQQSSAKASSSDAAIRASLNKLAPGIKITSIKPSPMAGLTEIIVDGQVLYVSNDGKYLIQGAIIDTATRTNLTEISESAVRKAVLATIPPTQKISFSPANPKYRVTVFTDIDCGYCRKMHAQMDEYNRLGIAVDYLFFPRGGMKSEAAQKAINVWCAPDRKLAMTSAKNGKSLPDKKCANFVAEDYAIGRQLGVDGTPAVYAANGMQLGGYRSPKDLLDTLKSLAN